MSHTNILRLIIAALPIIIPTPAHSDSIKDFWAQTAVAEHLQSAKSSLALELCIGMEMSEQVGAPNVLHGEAETVLTSIAGVYQNYPIAGARIIDHGSSREIAIAARKGTEKRMDEAVRACV